MRGHFHQDDSHIDLLSQAHQDQGVYYENHQEGDGHGQTANYESEDSQPEEYGHGEHHEAVDHDFGHKFDEEDIGEAEHERNGQAGHDLASILRDIQIVLDVNVSLLADIVGPSDYECAEDDKEEDDTANVVTATSGNWLRTPFVAFGVILLLVALVRGD